MSKEETTTAASARVQADDVVDKYSRHYREVAAGEDARINILGSANNFADETNFGRSIISNHGVNFFKKNALGGDCDKSPLTQTGTTVTVNVASSQNGMSKTR